MLLSFLGIAFLLFIGKFIWDTYITGETERQHQIHKRNNPEEVARMENTVNKGEYFNFNYAPKSSAEHKAISLALLANKIGCEDGQVKEHYTNGLIKMIMESGASNTQIIQILSETLKQIRQSKGTEAVQFGIDPDDTPAAFTELWLKELLTIIEVKQESLVAQNQKVSEIAAIPYTYISDDVLDILTVEERSAIESGKTTLAYFKKLYVKFDDERPDAEVCYERVYFSTVPKKNVDLRVGTRTVVSVDFKDDTTATNKDEPGPEAAPF